MIVVNIIHTKFVHFIYNTLWRYENMSIAVFFGGKSCEHNISIVTGVQLLNAIKSLHPVPVYIRPDGVWETGEELFDLNFYSQKKKKKLKKVFLTPGCDVLQAPLFKIAKLDGAVLCCHGMNGEDGSLQGLLTLCNIPFTGSGIAASAICLDKVLLKKVLLQSGIKQLPYISFTKKEFNTKTCDISGQLDEIGWPLVVKPARLGSSIGVKLVRDEPELVDAVSVAFYYDNTVVVEKGLEGFIELNCAALGTGDDVTVSEVEKPLGWKEILTFKDKYGQAKTSVKREFPANIPDSVRSEVQELTAKSFKAAGCSGVARVDFMLDTEGQLWLNEINTIPGSLSAYLFKPKMNETELVNRLISIAKTEKSGLDRLTYAYKSELFSSKQG